MPMFRTVGGWPMPILALVSLSFWTCSGRQCRGSRHCFSPACLHVACCLPCLPSLGIGGGAMTVFSMLVSLHFEPDHRRLANTGISTLASPCHLHWRPVSVANLGVFHACLPSSPVIGVANDVSLVCPQLRPLGVAHANCLTRFDACPPVWAIYKIYDPLISVLVSRNLGRLATMRGRTYPHPKSVPTPLKATADRRRKSSTGTFSQERTDHMKGDPI